MKKFNVFKSLNILLFGGLLFPQFAGAITFTVNTTEDKLDFVQCTPQTPNKCSLRAALIWSNQLVGTDTIILPEGVYTLTRIGQEPIQGNPTAWNDLDITDSVTLQGAGKNKTIIDGMNQTRIFEIKDILNKTQRVALSDLNLRHGKITSDGPETRSAAIYAFSQEGLEQIEGDRDSLELKRVRIHNNLLEGWGLSGAALFSNAELLLIEDSEFDHNEHLISQGSGSAGALMSLRHATQMIIQRNRFHHNLLGPKSDGALIAFILNEQVWWDRNELSQNEGKTQITITSNNGTLLFSNSTISSNDGAVFTNSANLQLLHMTITQNNLANKNDRIIWNVGGGELWMKNSIITGEDGVTCLVEDPGLLFSLGNNISNDNSCGLNQVSDLVNTDPLLGPLQSNGGFGLTHMPLAASPAVNHGETLAEVKIDQRGISRPIGASSDIGAVERNVVVPCFPGSCLSPAEK